MDKVIINKKEFSVQEKFLDFLSFLEGIKTHCKVMHWGIIHINVNSKRGAHIYLDNFLDKISEYEDMIAETSQGILGNYITINNLKGKSVVEGVAENPNDLCKWLLKNIYIFYNILEDLGNEFVGIKSETETFIKDIQQYNYLFSLCKNNLYK